MYSPLKIHAKTKAYLFNFLIKELTKSFKIWPFAFIFVVNVLILCMKMNSLFDTSQIQPNMFRSTVLNYRADPRLPRVSYRSSNLPTKCSDYGKKFPYRENRPTLRRDICLGTKHICTSTTFFLKKL